MRLRYFREGHLAQLKKGVKDSAILNLYSKKDVWLDEYFDENNWSVDSNIFIQKIELMKPDDQGLHDLENTRFIYDELKILKPYHANEERIWAYFTHSVFWDYMISRWPNEERSNNSIIERYFFSGQSKRALLRNGISRLWWFGYMTYDEKYADPYMLTKVLLSKQDIAESIMGRAFSNNRKIIKSILIVLKEYNENIGSYPERNILRNLCEYLSYIGGVMVLDVLTKNELEVMLREALDSYN